MDRADVNETPARHTDPNIEIDGDVLKHKTTLTEDDVDDEPRMEARVLGLAATPEETGVDHESVLETTYPEGGYGYVVVFACIMIGACTAGSVSALGIYQAEYAERFPNKSSFEVNLIGGFMGFVRASHLPLAASCD